MRFYRLLVALFASVYGRNNPAGKNYQIQLDVEAEKVAEVNKLKTRDSVTAEGRCVGVVPQNNPTDIYVQIKATKNQ